MKNQQTAAVRKLCAFLCASTLFLGAGLGTAQAQSDVTQPGDPVVPSSNNSPGSEGVANVIDNTQAKYLNFDLDNDAPAGPKPAGFAVTPSVGVTRVIGMTIQSANDAADRDPQTVTLEGSNDGSLDGFSGATNTWTLIVGITNIPAFTARFQRQSFFFDNFTPYRHYRWTVLRTQGPSTCCMQVAEVELLGSTLPPDVTQPGDPVIPSSNNSPGSEGVANVIDNTQAKYLNFDLDNDAPAGPKPAGFAVSPSIGRSLVTGLTIQSANDAADRDPHTVTLEGSNDGSLDGFNGSTNTWELIVGITNIPTFTARFQTQTFLFDNYKPYRHYRWTVYRTQGPSTCCMQVAEVQILGTGAPKDITQPGDPIIASSNNSPGSEGVANAIDNTQAKYLNFDLDNDAPAGPKPAGFAVSPAIGAATVIGMTIQSANDAADRDPKTVIIEGCNDGSLDGFNGATNTWEFVVGITNIPTFTARFQTKEFFFANKKAYRHYRWTVLETQGPSTCCMQVAEVELLAATQSNPCNQVAFTRQPVDTPALAGTPATFLAKVNGPWTVQWLKNGQPIPGATTLNYSTPPVDASVVTNAYSIAIVGCQTSAVVHASVFTPSTTESIGISFRGGGANGAPTDMLTNDIAGFHLQAFWNNLNGGNGSLPQPINSSNVMNATIGIDWATSGTWGVGTGNEDPIQRMLNGMDTVFSTDPATPQTVTINGVPTGRHSLLLYTVQVPLEFFNMDFSVVTHNAAGADVIQQRFIRPQNSDEYKPSPGFILVTATNAATRSVGNMLRFDNLQVTDGFIEIRMLSPGRAQPPGGQPIRGPGLNAFQLLLNTPTFSDADLPRITQQPDSANGVVGGSVTLSVQATGPSLTYQWLKNGQPIPGATGAQLALASLSTNDVANYSVAVQNPAGRILSRTVVVGVLKTGQVTEGLIAYFKFDEKAGTTATNSVSGGQNGTVNGAAPTWSAGKIGGALSFNGSDNYVFVPNYTKPSQAMSAAGWVNSSTDLSGPIINNWVLGQNIGASGQFFVEVATDATLGVPILRGQVAVGPNQPLSSGVITNSAINAWHHFAMSANGVTLSVYWDGALVSTIDYLGAINTPSSFPWLAIGADLTADSPPIINATPSPNVWTGAMDDVALWNRSLSGAEIQSIYQAGQAGQALDGITTVQPPRVTIVRNADGSVTITSSAGTIEQSNSLNTPTWTSAGAGPINVPAAQLTGTRYYRAKQ